MSSIIQPRFYEDAYPIGRLVFDRAKSLGLSRTELVQRLGYANLNTGHRALTELLMTGAPSPIIAGKLGETLEIEQDLVDAIMLATLRQKSDEARVQMLDREEAYMRSFRPHLRSETARTIPEPIFIAALLTTARLRVVPTPEDIWSASPDERDRTLKRAIREHFRDQRGSVPAFGRIVAYTAVVMVGYRSDFGYPYDVDGNPAGPMQQVGRLGEAVFGTSRGDARLTGLLKNTAVTVISAGDDHDPSL
jgi:hypothetical protein